MPEEYYIWVCPPFIRGKLPVSIGLFFRSKKGCYIENIMIAGDALPIEVCRDVTFMPPFEGFPPSDELVTYLYSDLSTDDTIPVEYELDLCADALGIRKFAELHIKLPPDRTEEVNAQFTYRYDETGLSVSIIREDTGEPIDVEIVRM